MRTIPNLSRDGNRNPHRGGQATIGTFGIPGGIRDRVSRPAPAKPAAPAPVAGIKLRSDRFQAFVRLSEREQRPVEEVMGEWMAECANLIQQAEFADTYGDALPSSNAMRLAAIQADERGRRADVDDEQADFARRCAGAGFVEFTLAMEGN